MYPLAANSPAPERGAFSIYALRALPVVPPCAPVGIVRKSMKKY
jgi:hypothetical protein